MPTLRNPGPWSFAIFACACLLVGFLFWRGAPDATKLAGALIACLVSAFGAKSALASAEPRASRDSRAPMHTWPGPLEDEPIEDSSERELPRAGGEK